MLSLVIIVMRQSVHAIINDCHDKITIMYCCGLKRNNYGSGQGIASSKWKHHNRGNQITGCTERSGVVLASFTGLETERGLILLFAHPYMNFPI